MKQIITLLFIVISVIGFSQKKAEVSLALLDGSVIKGTIILSDIDISPDYGKLIVPVGKLSHIDFGLRKDKSINERATSFLTILNNINSDDTRKAAYQDLVKLGPKAISVIQDFNDNPKNTKEDSQYTGEHTIDNAWATIKLNNNISNTIIIEDVFLLENNYKIGGNYNFTKLEVKTDYGNRIIAKEKIKSIDITVPFDNINSDSQITNYSNSTASPNYGNVVYKIGETSADNLKIDAELNAVAKNSDMLFLSIYETMYDPNNQRSYTVKTALEK